MCNASFVENGRTSDRGVICAILVRVALQTRKYSVHFAAILFMNRVTSPQMMSSVQNVKLMLRRSHSASVYLLANEEGSTSTLAQHGFIVIRNAFKLEEDTIDLIEDSQFYPIFNGVDEEGLKLTYDGKRVMATGQWRGAFKRKLKDFLCTQGLLKCKNGEKSISEVYALRSLNGCLIQPKHADSATEEGLRKMEPSDVPLAVLYAIEANTKLKVWPFDQEYPVVVTLQPNDIIIFRGDTAHAGYKYNVENTRLHAYINSTAPGCKRIKGKTYILVNQTHIPCKVNYHAK